LIISISIFNCLSQVLHVSVNGFVEVIVFQLLLYQSLIITDLLFLAFLLHQILSLLTIVTFPLKSSLAQIICGLQRALYQVNIDRCLVSDLSPSINGQFLHRYIAPLAHPHTLSHTRNTLMLHYLVLVRLCCLHVELCVVKVGAMEEARIVGILFDTMEN
jgi:hypothetical protein